ncbi:MAG: hypothetical protein KME32_34270 [Mojavia pulchra JT2-VF2]|jgi:hypothetical protein|uniref:Uncharacterized protein n=1 Tax=Mojavia pulchra JT2-VF2 TaxID=287848 RepID=A0A951Q597_9NOST|nr:hypothetical protein [Mojavia pulchra JT2-VF2]
MKNSKNRKSVVVERVGTDSAVLPQHKAAVAQRNFRNILSSPLLISEELLSICPRGDGTKFSYLLRQAGGNKKINVFKAIAVVRVTNDYSFLPQSLQIKELIFVPFGPRVMEIQRLSKELQGESR